MSITTEHPSDAANHANAFYNAHEVCRTEFEFTDTEARDAE